MATDKIWSSCESILGDTAKTIDLEYVNVLVISNRSGASLYVKFGWGAGDTEISVANFDLCIGDGGIFSMSAATLTFPRVENMRVVSASSGRVAVMGW